MVRAFRVNLTSVGTFDSYDAIVEASPLFTIRISVENCDALVWEYLELTWRRKRPVISLESEQRARPASEWQPDTGG